MSIYIRYYPTLKCFYGSFRYWGGLSIYLTLSTHSPFVLKNQSYYEQRVIDRLHQLKTPTEEMPSYLKNQQKLATFLFFDDELRNFFKEYKKRKDFKNTIFIITGDHRGIIFSRTSQIDLYHTPLIIYSPLLKEAKEFGGISSHADLTPTLLNYLENNYKIKTPPKVSWLGNLLDTSRDFHSQQCYAFMRNNREIQDYIHDDYYLSAGMLYKIHDTLHLTRIENNSIKQQLEKELKEFKNINDIAIVGLQNQSSAGSKVLVSSFYNFEDSIPLLFKNTISQKFHFSGNKSAVLEKDQNYGAICPNILLKDDVLKIFITISFKAYTNAPSKQSPFLVMSIDKGEKNLKWNSYNIVENTANIKNNWKQLRISATLSINPNDSKDSELKLYLWNRNNSLLYYDDLEIKISTLSQ